MKSGWQVAGVISEFMGVLALPLVIEGLAVRLCLREVLAGYWARVSEHPRGMPGSPQNRAVIYWLLNKVQLRRFDDRVEN